MVLASQDVHALSFEGVAFGGEGARLERNFGGHVLQFADIAL